MSFELSEYQRKIKGYFLTHPHNNMAIEAKAGAGKTSTALMLTDLTKSSDVYIAFNKSIQMEMKAKLRNPKTKCYTMHGLALSVMSYNLDKLHKKYELDNYKVIKIVDKLFEKEYKNSKLHTAEMRDYLETNYLTTYNLVRLKCVPIEVENIEYLVNDMGLFQNENQCTPPLIQEITDWIQLIDEMSIEDFEQEYKCDFTDMLYITLKKLQSKEWEIPYWLLFTNIYLDECLPYNTYIKTNIGDRKIGDLYKNYIKHKDLPLVKSFNHQTQKYEYKQIVNVKKHENRKVYEIKTEGLNKIKATSNHKFLTQRGYICVEDLRIGEDYLCLDCIEAQKTKYLLNDDQLQIVLGSFLGDGNLEKRSNFNTYRLNFTQGDKQLNYLKWKMKIFHCDKMRNMVSGYTSKKNIYASSTKTFILEDTPWNLMNLIDARGLAIWFQDDGSSFYHDYIKTGRDVNSVRIAANNLNEEQINFMIDLLKNKYQIYATKRLSHEKYFDIVMNTENSRNFLKLIAPYMHPDCYYKNENNIPNKPYEWNDNFKTYGGNFITEINYCGTEDVYDIEVKDNHNFVCKVSNLSATGIISHNCQDLSKLQYSLLPYFKRTGGRFVFVYDSLQAIYGFAGADCKATQNIMRMFYPIEKFELPINYRCGKNILEYVNDQHSAGILPRPNANEGNVIKITEGRIHNYVKPDDFIIGRRNRDLIDIALKLIKKNFKIYLTDKEIVTTIVKFVKSLKKKTVSEVTTFCDDFIKAQAKITDKSEIAKNAEMLEKVRTVKILLDSYTSSSQAVNNFINHIQTIINTEDPTNCIRIMSIHKSKGLEADNVFVLHEGKPFVNLARSRDMLQQEKNLSYVALTRAKENLYLVECSEDCGNDEKITKEYVSAQITTV